MKIIISPAKQMKIVENCKDFSTPIFIKEANEIRNTLKSLDKESLKKAWVCNDKIVEENIKNLSLYDINNPCSAAIFTYNGIQYKYLNADSLDFNSISYLNNHLYILDGLYGALRPLDGIVPYRLMMESIIEVNGFKDLYKFWNHKIYDLLYKDNDVVINLASSEFSSVIKPYLKDDDIMIDILFANLINEKIVVKGTEAKMCRGLMSRFLALNKIEDLEDIKKFNELGFKFSEKHSNSKTFIFLKEK